jgi:hypothetical protein
MGLLPQMQIQDSGFPASREMCSFPMLVVIFQSYRATEMCQMGVTVSEKKILPVRRGAGVIFVSTRIPGL